MASNSIPAKSQKQLRNQRQYQSIWDAIKKTQPGVVTQVRCHTTAVQRIIQAVKKEKTADVGIKRKLGMLTAGSLTIIHNPEELDGKITDFSIIEFSLQWDGSKL